MPRTGCFPSKADTKARPTDLQDMAERWLGSENVFVVLGTDGMYAARNSSFESFNFFLSWVSMDLLGKLLHSFGRDNIEARIPEP